jgi:hypothetical protein
VFRVYPDCRKVVVLQTSSWISTHTFQLRTLKNVDNFFTYPKILGMPSFSMNPDLGFGIWGKKISELEHFSGSFPLLVDNMFSLCDRRSARESVGCRPGYFFVLLLLPKVW